MDNARWAIVAQDLRAVVDARPDDFRHKWPGALMQARTNRDLAYLAWCMGNFQPRWDGDTGERLRPTREEPVPGFRYGCYDAAYIALAWPPEAVTAGTAFFNKLDAEYETILAEAKAKLAETPDDYTTAEVAKIAARAQAKAA